MPDALARAQADPSRGVSKEHSFLAEVSETWSLELHLLAADVVIDTETASVEQAVARVRDAIRATRSRVQDSPRQGPERA